MKNLGKILKIKMIGNLFRLTRYILLISLAFPINLFSQTYDSLNTITGHKAKVYCSNGAGKRAEKIADRCDKVFAYYKASINFEPSVNLLILNPKDWTTYSAKGAVYGMPHYTTNQTLVVASEDNAFWKSFIPPVDKLPEDLAKTIVKTYSDENGVLTMQPFFDLLAIHELGHAFHMQGELIMQRKWMQELFANIFLHTYIADNESELLQSLTVFPEMVIKGGTNDFKYITLTEFENKYNEIATENPKNYGWYQCRLHYAASTIYNLGGSNVIKNLWATLQKQKKPLNDSSFANLLANDVHTTVADVQLQWENK